MDIETTSDTGGGYDINNTAAGEWLEYTIWVQSGLLQLEPALREHGGEQRR